MSGMLKSSVAWFEAYSGLNFVQYGIKVWIFFVLQIVLSVFLSCLFCFVFAVLMLRNVMKYHEACC